MFLLPAESRFGCKKIQHWWYDAPGRLAACDSNDNNRRKRGVLWT